MFWLFTHPVWWFGLGIAALVLAIISHNHIASVQATVCLVGSAILFRLDES